MKIDSERVASMKFKVFEASHSVSSVRLDVDSIGSGVLQAFYKKEIGISK